jgi:hypothetical protein
MKILGPHETGKGILIEYDAGHISPEENKQIIKEMRELDFSQDIILYAVLQKFDTPNKNGRIYPEMLLKRENEKYQTLIKKGGALNELNHPSSSLIDLDRVSHSILETFWDGKMLMGKIKLFTSPGWRKMGIVSTKGDQAAMLIMNGATLGISSRGVGSLKNVKGQNIVQEDFELVCFDLVSSPSTPGAYVFPDLSDRDKYQESIEEKSDEGMNKMKSLMGKLDSFLSK